MSQFNARSSSTSPPLPASKEPAFEGMKPPQYSYGADGQRDKGVQNWGAPTVTEKLAQLIATCPPSKTPKPVKPAKTEAAPLQSSGFMAPTAKQRDRALANRNTYSRMVHLSPPPPVSRPPGRPYGSRIKDCVMEAPSAMTSFAADDAEGHGKAGSMSNNNNISSSSGSGSSRSSSPALVYGSGRLSALSKDSGNDNGNGSVPKAQSRSAHAATSSSCPLSSSSTSIFPEQRTISAVSHLGSPAPSQGHHARESPALAEESSASMTEQERNGPRDLTKCPPPAGTGKSEGRDKLPVGHLLNAQRGRSCSPGRRSPNRDNSRCGQAGSLAEAIGEPSSPEPDVEDGPQTPLGDDSPDSSVDSPNEQESKPLKKRRGRKPRWNRIMIKAQTHRAGEDLFDHSKPGLPLPSSFELPSPPMKRPVGRPPNPNKVKPVLLSHNAASQLFPPQAKKRGRPKSKMPRLDAPARGCLSSKLINSKVFALKSKEEQDPPVLHPEVDLNPPKPLPRKRGRPKRLPPTLPQEGQPPTLAPESGEMGDKLFHSKGNGQLIMKTIIGKINKMKSMKRKRILSQILLGPRTEEVSKSSSSVAASSGETATQSLSTLAASFGGKLGPQINVSKKGTIYMGKRRGRKPKAAAATAAPSTDSFLSPNTSSPLYHHHHHHHHHLQSQQHLSSEIFPSPSLSQSSGGHSPISDGFVEPGSVHFPSHSHHGHHSHSALAFPPPTFSAPNPRGLGLGSVSSAATAASQKKSGCRGYHHHHHHYRQHFHYHKLSPPRPLHPTSPAPLSELKEATPSPVSESHSEETVPSDSGIGTDNNSTSDRGEKAGGAGGLGGIGMPAGMGSSLLMPGVMGAALGPGVALNSRGRRRLMEHPSASPSPHGARSSSDPRRSHAAAPASSLTGHKEKHKHKCKRRSHGCPGYDKLKRQKRKRKKKYLQLRSRRHDPDFLAQLDEIVVRLSEIRISHRMAGLRLSGDLGLASGTSRVQGVGGRAIGGAGGPPSHHYVHRDLLPTIFRVNFGSFYSHPAYSCDPLHYVRKPDMKKKRGRPPKLRESMSEVPFVPGLGFPLSSGGFYHPSYGVPYSSGPLGLGYYRGYPPASALYPHPHHQSPHAAPSHHSHHSPTFPPPPPASYMHHHHASHLLLNPSKFHKKKHKLLRQEYLGSGRAPVLYPPMSSELSFNWHHKHKHRHKHRERCVDEDREETARAGADSRLGGGGVSESGAPGKGERVGGLGVAESLQRCRFGRDPSGVAAGKQAASASANSPSSSSSSSAADRYKRKENSASCIGPSRLALSTSKSHLPVESWFRMGSSKAEYSKLSQPHAAQGQGLFSDGRAGDPAGCSESEDEEPLTPAEEAEARVHESSNHTNLFASALTRTPLKGSKSRKTEGVREGSTFSRVDRPMRKDRSTSVEKRELGMSALMYTCEAF